MYFNATQLRYAVYGIAALPPLALAPGIVRLETNTRHTAQSRITIHADE